MPNVLMLFAFQVLVCILSVVDDTKLITKVGFKFNKTVSCGKSRVSCVRFSNLIFLLSGDYS